MNQDRARRVLLIFMVLGLLGVGVHRIHELTIKNTGSFVCNDPHTFNFGADLDAVCTAGVLTVTQGSLITKLGPTIGCALGEVDADIVDGCKTAVQTLKSDLAFNDGGTGSGSNTVTLATPELADNTTYTLRPPVFALGGNEIDPNTAGTGSGNDQDFTYAGQSSCSGDSVCRGGTCSGSVCTLTLNSRLGVITDDGNVDGDEWDNDISVYQTYSSFKCTSGTIRIAALAGTVPKSGSSLVIRVSGKMEISGSCLIDLEGRGFIGSPGGTIAAAGGNGKAGTHGRWLQGGSGGAATPTAGLNGRSMPTDPSAFIPSALLLPWIGGGGGGHITSAWGPETNDVYNGASGGGGGGCTASATGSVDAQRDHGGGFFYAEVAGDFTCSGTGGIEASAETDSGTPGSAASPGHAGSAGGGVLVLAGGTIVDTCTIRGANAVQGATKGSITDGIECAAHGDAGDGVWWVKNAPY